MIGPLPYRPDRQDKEMPKKKAAPECIHSCAHKQVARRLIKREDGEPLEMDSITYI